MIKNIIFFTIFIFPLLVNAQLVNNGAVITIQPNAVLRVDSDIFNNGTSTITNNGTIEVSGDFTNESTATLTPDIGLIKFFGTGNSDFDSGEHPINDLQLSKTTSTGQVTLTSPLSLSGNITFDGTDNNKLFIDNFNLTMTDLNSTVSANTDYSTNGWIVTDKTGINTGKFIKSVNSGVSTKVLEIGDDTNYSPVSMTVDASSVGTVGARVLTNNLTPKYSEATDYINREWVIETTNVTSNVLTGTYAPADVTGDAGLIKGANYYGSDWNFAGADKSTNNVIASTNNANVNFSGMNFFGKVNLKAFLQGAYSGGSMTTTLNTSGLIPLTSPYVDAPATVTSIPANVTDWVKLELRDPASPGTATDNKASAFIKSDGSIVGLDGTSLARVKNGYSSSVVAFYHRNHLPFRTNTGLDVINPSLEDFTITNTKLYDNGADNAPLNTVSGNFVMWPCDAAGSTFLINSTDLGYVKSQTATTPTGYLRADVNLSGAANSTDLGMTKLHTAVPKSADL